MPHVVPAQLVFIIRLAVIIMDPNFAWIYLAIFLLIPLSRIIPRMIAKRRKQNNADAFEERIPRAPDRPVQTTNEPSQAPDVPGQSWKEKPQTINMLVLGALNRGSNTFEKIQKETGLGSAELEKSLEDLEQNGHLYVRQKQGLFGTKTELYPTDDQ